MANEELIALLKHLQGPAAGNALNPGLLTQLPALLSGAAETGPLSSAAGTGPLAGESRASSIASTALRSVGGGLTLLPVVSSLLKLFGVGRAKEALPALEKFTLPEPIRAEAGLSRSGETFLIDRGMGDRIRPLTPPQTGAAFAGESSQARPSGSANITVNVQAMDSQSFLDRREDIARAVREAMLESHSLNDVVSEL